jgi:hypothetical protein
MRFAGKKRANNFCHAQAGVKAFLIFFVKNIDSFRSLETGPISLAARGINLVHRVS